MNNLQKYKDNCEEGLIITPLSVLRYINTLENHIAEVSKMAHENSGLEDMLTSLNEEYTECEKELAELKESTRWRKVGDELPDNENADFLVLFDSGYIATVGFYRRFWPFDNVTHWMPLPVSTAV